MLLTMIAEDARPIRIAIFGVCLSVSLLYVLAHVLRERRAAAVAAPPPSATAPGGAEEELLAAVNVLVTNRLKEIDDVIARGDGHGIEEMGETEARVRQAREYSLSSAIARSPDLVLDPHALLKVALNRAWRILRIRSGAAILWTDEAAGIGRVAAMEGREEEGAPAEIMIDAMSRETLRHAALMTWRSDHLIPGLNTAPALQIGVPIQIESDSWGWFLLETDEDRDLTALETRFLSALGRETAAALAALEDWRALREKMREVLARLGDHLDARRQKKGGRGGRVAALFESAARRIGFNPVEIETGKLAAFLIDLGEVGVPELVLNKEGSLSPQELKFVREHPALSVKLLREFLLLDPLEHAIIAHHETWIGNGYPSGLKREEIPRAARLLSVCDAVEAMISERPYRDAYDAAEAIGEVKKRAGTQFDPAMVDVVEKVYEPWINWLLAK